MSAVKPIPDGFHSITPSLVVDNAAEAIEFYKKAFGAEELSRMPMPDGRVGHSELKFGDSIIFVSDEFPEMGIRSPKSLGGTHGGLGFYVEDADAVFEKAVAAGATPVMPLMDAFWGDRYGKVTDPYGHTWSVMTHVKDLTMEEITEASKEYFKESESAASS
jgi:PhnB protein